MINWGLANTGGFQNALSTGLQMGQFARQRQEEREGRNALSAFITNPNDQTAAALAPYNPRLAYQYGQDQRANQVAQADLQREQMATFRKLLDQAGDNPQQAYAAAQQMGIDLSQVPQPGTPEFEPWRQRQIFIFDALESEGDNLPGLAREVMLALPEDQRDPNGTAFQQAFTAALENKYAAEYVDAQGNTRRRAIIGNPPQAAQRTPLLPMAQRPQGKTDEQLFAEARAAVEAGADVDAVFRQLREWGVEVN